MIGAFSESGAAERICLADTDLSRDISSSRTCRSSVDLRRCPGQAVEVVTKNGFESPATACRRDFRPVVHAVSRLPLPRWKLARHPRFRVPHMAFRAHGWCGHGRGASPNPLPVCGRDGESALDMSTRATV